MRTILLLAAVLVVALLVRLALVRPVDPGSAGLESSVASASAEPELALEGAGPAAAESRTSVASPVSDVRIVRGDFVRSMPPTDRAVVVARVTSIETDEPIAAVPIRAQWTPETDPTWWRAPSTAEETTGEDGVAELDVPAGVRITLRAPGDGARRSFAEGAVDVLEIGERRDLSLRVHTGDDLVVHGLVLASDTNAPIGGVLVESVPPAVVVLRDPPHTTTANDGTFELPLRSFATSHLEYSHARYGSTRSGFSEHGSPDKRVVVLLEPSAAIDARVVDKAKRPTEWWQVVALDLEEEEPDFHGVPGAPEDPPSSPARLRRAGGTIAGGVHDGTAELRGLKAGVPLALEVRRGKSVLWRSRAPIVLSRGERRAMTIELGGASLRGFVRNAAGDVVPNAAVIVQPADELAPDPSGDLTSRMTALSDETGAYRLDGLEPGEWLLACREHGAGSWTDPRSYGLLVERIVLREGVLERDVVVAPSGRISGRVVTSDGYDFDGEVLGRREGDPSRARSYATEGSFLLDVQGVGDWILEAHGRSGASEPVRARAGATDVVLTIPPPAVVEIVGVDERGRSIAIDAPVLVAVDEGNVYLYSPVRADGVWTIRGLRAAKYHVFARDPGGRYGLEHDVAVTATSDRKQRIEVVMRESGRARVRFDGPDAESRIVLLDRGIALESVDLPRGVEREITGPLGEVELRIVVGERTYERRVTFARELGEPVVFDGGWR